MSDAVMPPTPAIQSAAMHLEEAVGRLMKALAGCDPLGRYEADVECLNLLRLIIRHVESVIELACRDLVLLPSAMVLARAGYETAIKLLWIADPDDPFQREVRWLAHLQSGEDYYMKMAAQEAKLGGGGEAKQKVAELIRQFRTNVTAQLPQGYAPLKKMPNLYQMLESLDEERKYPLYLIGCQFAHSTTHASGIYCQHLGGAKVLGEFIDLKDWWLCLSMSWYSLHAGGQRFLKRAGGNTADFLSIEFGDKVNAAIEALNPA